MQRAHAVALAFFDGNRDVGLPSLVRSNQGNSAGHEPLIYSHVLDDRVFHQHLEIAVVLVNSADSDFHVFVQLGAVECLG